MTSIDLRPLVRNFTAKSMTLLADILNKAKRLDLLKEVETLLRDYLNVDSSKLFLMRSEELSPDVLVRVKSDIARLESGYPLAYLRGKANFYGLEFYVDENVLIPRPETEMLVDKTIECIKKLFVSIGKKSLEISNFKIHVVELGVGSGCISIAVAKSVPGHIFVANLSQQLAILGIEKSEKALKVAKKNLKTFAVDDIVTFKKGDLLQWVKRSQGADNAVLCDILVANLPYVAPNDPSVQESVRKYEPHEALFANEGGLALYRKVFEQLLKKKMRPAHILFEIGFDQGVRIIEMCNAMMPDYDAEILKDLENRDRVLKMTSPT